MWWLLYSHFCLSLHLSYLGVITSNFNCFNVVTLINCSVFISWSFKNFVFHPPPPPYYFNITSILLCVLDFRFQGTVYQTQLHDLGTKKTAILTLILLTWRMWWAPNNASKWHMWFNLAFKGWIIIAVRVLYLKNNSWLEILVIADMW
jgi:hypothetical protein